MPDYPYSPAGQAAWMRDQLLFGSNNPNLRGFFYFYPEWFPGMDTDPSSWNLQSGGLLAAEYQPQPALDEYFAYAVRACFLNPVFTGQNLLLNWAAVPGQRYNIESSSDLRHWQRCATGLLATSNTMTWSTNTAQMRQFYQVSRWRQNRSSRCGD